MTANYYPVDEDYQIGKVEVENNKLFESNYIKTGLLEPMLK